MDCQLYAFFNGNYGFHRPRLSCCPFPSFYSLSSRRVILKSAVRLEETEGSGTVTLLIDEVEDKRRVVAIIGARRRTKTT